MIEIATKYITEEWMTAIVEPEEQAESIDEISREKGWVNDLLGNTNEIWLGKPEAFNLETFLPKTLESKFRSKFATNDYILVQFTCSFRPSINCEFVRASIKVNLRSQAAQQVIAFEMFPQEIFMPVTYKRGISIDPNLKIQAAKVLQAEVSAFKYENSQEYIVYQPEITAYAKGTNTPVWDFNKTSNRPLQGNKDLFLIIKKPKSVSALASFEISNCQVRTLNLGLVKLPRVFNKSSMDPVIEKEYIIP